MREGGAPAPPQPPPWRLRPSGFQTEACPTVTCVGSGGEEQEVGPTGPAGESEMVGARGEEGQPRPAVSQLLASEPAGPESLPPASAPVSASLPQPFPPRGAPSFPLFSGP